MTTTELDRQALHLDDAAVLGADVHLPANDDVAASRPGTDM